jgi:hypothetical protein
MSSSTTMDITNRMIGGSERFSIVRIVDHPVAIWTCRVPLWLYSAGMLLAMYWQVTDWETTLLLVDSDCACGLEAGACGIRHFVMSWVLCVLFLMVVAASELTGRWRYRNVLRVAAVPLAIATWVHG